MSNTKNNVNERTYLKDKVWNIIFLSNTKSGKYFDLILLITISLSVITIALESIPKYKNNYGLILLILEWVFTIFFTIEYIVRILVSRNKKKYIFSFFGIIDLLSIIPTYLTFFIAGAQFLLIIRVLRLLRIFRVLKLIRYIKESNMLINAIKSSSAKIFVFLFFIIIITMILGTTMYFVEGIIYKNSAFSNIPQSIYWAIVTISTVGYGDIVPTTAIGKFISIIIILIGYGTVAVPTGIITAELHGINFSKILIDNRKCKECGQLGHDNKAIFCKVCGTKL